MKNEKTKNEKIRLIAILILCLFVFSTGIIFAVTTFKKGEIIRGILSIFIAISILSLAIFVYIRGNKDLKEGFPLKDERSKKVMEKATSKAFYVSLYFLLAIGYLSNDIIKFRDVSQAISLGVAGMAILFVGFWTYYNKKEI